MKDIKEYWQPELETMPREELEKLQVKKLKESIRVAMKSEFYGKRFAELGLTPDDFNTVADIRKIPFTTKQDLRDNYPFGLVGGDMKDAIRIHSTSGTTGHPTVVTYSRHDIDSWANMIARDMYMVGCRDTDVFQNSSGYWLNQNDIEGLPLPDKIEPSGRNVMLPEDPEELSIINDHWYIWVAEGLVISNGTYQAK